MAVKYLTDREENPCTAWKKTQNASKEKAALFTVIASSSLQHLLSEVTLGTDVMLTPGQERLDQVKKKAESHQTKPRCRKTP